MPAFREGQAVHVTPAPYHGKYAYTSGGRRHVVEAEDGSHRAVRADDIIVAVEPGPPPATPGTVIVATVRGIPGAVLMRDGGASEDVWFNGEDGVFIDDADITDWRVVDVTL